MVQVLMENLTQRLLAYTRTACTLVVRVQKTTSISSAFVPRYRFACFEALGSLRAQVGTSAWKTLDMKSIAVAHDWFVAEINKLVMYNI